MNSTETAWHILNEVMDPELPEISIVDLGMVRSVLLNEDLLHVVITPTFSGCPAKETILSDIKSSLSNHFSNVCLEVSLSPPWDVNDIKKTAYQKLKNIGIAPPVSDEKSISCPRCNSLQVSCLSVFGSASCKSLYKCRSCLEPFEYFKSIGKLRE